MADSIVDAVVSHECRAADISSAQEHVVFESKIANAERGNVDGHCGGAKWCSKSARVKLGGGAAQRHRGGDEECALSRLMLELWTAEALPSADSSDGTHALLSFVGCARVDLEQWREAPWVSAKRWYALQCDRTSAKEAWSTSESSSFVERKGGLVSDAVYFQVTLVGLCQAKKTKNKAAPEPKADVKRSSSPPASANTDFQFSLPSQSITQNRRFLSTRVGEIVHEVSSQWFAMPALKGTLTSAMLL